MKKRFTEEQIIGFLREADAGVAIKDLCRRHGFSEASYYLWRSTFGAMSVPDAKRLKDLEAENADRNVDLRQRIVALAHRHKRYGVGMIYLKLRKEGHMVNYKRVERLYQEQQLQVGRRKRKKVQVGQRQPLLRPAQANQVWSMDFVFDRTADGRVIKSRVIVDDAPP